MMSLLNYLGFLGLLSIVVLILIYIIKPNYQVKNISSTYVWKLSLKYSKKRVQTSTLRKFLLFLCQVLALATMAVIFTQPVWASNAGKSEEDVIAVLDSSASMYTETDGETRFARAVKQLIELTEETAKKGGNMTLILADDSPDYISRRTSPKEAGTIVTALQDMLDNEKYCSYGKSDIETAMGLCEDVLAESPRSTIYLYTDNQYLKEPSEENVKVISLAKEGEWNVGILNAEATIEEGYYELTVDIAAYGSTDIPVDLAVQVVLTDGTSRDFVKRVYCENGVTETVTFRYGGGVESGNLSFYDFTDEEKFSSFQSIHISFDMRDSFQEDNHFNVYGGQKEIVRIQYVSTQVNPFFPVALGILRNIYGDRWDIRVTEISEGGLYETSGYDFYIFEHTAPASLPRDGVILFSDPDSSPSGAGFTVRSKRSFNGQSASMTLGDSHPILKGLNPDDILLWEMREIIFDETMFVPILYCNAMPVVGCCNRDDKKIAVMGFSLNKSNIVREYDFMLFLSNLFGYYFPNTVEKYSFEVGEEITVNARGPKVGIKGTDTVFDKFPATIPAFTYSQTVTLTQDSYYDENYPDISIYVRLPAEESNIWRVEDELSDPFAEIVQEVETQNLIIWFAAALTALLLAEWWLQSRENR